MTTSTLHYKTASGQQLFPIPAGCSVSSVTLDGSPAAYSTIQSSYVLLNSPAAAGQALAITLTDPVIGSYLAHGVFAVDGAYGWDDIVGNPVIKGTGANDPSWAAFNGNIYAHSFSASAMKEMWFTYHIDHRYAPGTKIYLHTHWSTNGTNNGVCRWGFEYSFAKGHQQAAFPATTTVYVEQAATGVAKTHMIAEISVADAVPATNLETDGLLMVRVFRDAAHVNDTLSDAAFLLTADCHYQVSQFATKNKAPSFFG